MIRSLLILSTLTTTILSLSSHSPQDLFANPKFKVVLGNEGVSNETARELLLESSGSSSGSSSSSSSSNSNSKSETLHLIRNLAGQAFLCSVPIFEDKAAPAEQSNDDVAARKLERERGLERGLDLIESMKGGCLYDKQGWFTYSFW